MRRRFRARLFEERGQGRGIGGQVQRDGGADKCVCLSCGNIATHQREIPCNEFKCTKCGALMVGK